MKLIDLTGQRFNRLTVLEYYGQSKWLCKCDCGNETIVNAHKLKTGHTQSCGCLQKEKASVANTKHRLSDSRLYGIWSNIKDRCYRKNNPSYKDYGCRGILMCDEWKNDFLAFYNWSMNNGYEYNLTIDRIDNNGNYEPENCRWATRKQQNRNTRQCIYYEYKNKKITRGELSELAGYPYSKIRYWLNNNRSIESIINL